MTFLHEVPDSIALVLGRPLESDAKLVMDWRNDPETLRQSFHSTPKVWPDFLDEYLREYCDDPQFPPLFGAVGGKHVAFVRLRRCVDPARRNRRAVEIGINIAPGERGRGIGTPLLRQAVDFCRGQGVELVVAEIKPGNTASIAAFERAGFSRVGESSKEIPGVGAIHFLIHQLETVPVLRAARRDGSFREIGPGRPCFIIAEAGSNWRLGSSARDLRMAKSLIDVAAEAACDAVKFQTYRADTVYVENAGTSDYLSDAGIQESIRDIFVDLAMPYEMIPELAEHCATRGVMFMSTPFSTQDLDALDPFVGIHKLASYEISHRRLIEKMGKSGKPVIMSTGASHLRDIRWAVDHFRAAGGRELALLQCTARYPAPLDALNLGAMAQMRSIFGVPVGLSDHSRDPIAGPATATALGAAIIEKHFTLDRRLPGPDHAFAIEPEELAEMVRSVRNAEQSLGPGLKEVLPAEQELRRFARRGLQAIQSIAKGDVLKEGVNFDVLRPGKRRQGLHALWIERVEGREAQEDIALGDGILFSDVGIDDDG